MKLDTVDLVAPFVHVTGLAVAAFFVGRGTWWLIPVALYCGACAMGGAFHVGRYQGRLEAEKSWEDAS